jgi:hypothetical protein
MITYPDCQACDCTPEQTTAGSDAADGALPAQGVLTQISNPSLYLDSLIVYEEKITTVPVTDENYDTINQVNALILAPTLSGRADKIKNPTYFKDVQSASQTYPDNRNYFATTSDLPIGERINVFNLRNKYFQGVNKIKVTFASNQNMVSHYDNTLTVLSAVDAQPGDLLSFVSPSLSKDKNYLWTGQSESGGVLLNGINGTLKNKPFQIDVKYATSQTTDTSVSYLLPSGQTDCVVSFTVDVITNGVLTYQDCSGSAHTVTLIAGTTQTISNVNCINTTNISATGDYRIVDYGESCQRYVYPSDIEYYQVLTAITITKTVVNGTTQYSIPQLGTGYGI